MRRVPSDLIAVGDLMPRRGAAGCQSRAGASTAGSSCERAGPPPTPPLRLHASAHAPLSSAGLARMRPGGWLRPSSKRPALSRCLRATRTCQRVVRWSVVGGTSIVADPRASIRLVPEDLPATLEAGASPHLGLHPSPARPASRRACGARARANRLSRRRCSIGEPRRGLSVAERFLEATATAGVLFANAEEARPLTGLDADGAALCPRATVPRRLRQARPVGRSRRDRRRDRARRGATCRSRRDTRRRRCVRRRFPRVLVAWSGARRGPSASAATRRCPRCSRGTSVFCRPRPALEQVDLRPGPRPVARHRAVAQSGEDGVCVLADIVV